MKAVTHLEKVIAVETSAVTYTEKVITGEAPPRTYLQKVIAGEAPPRTHLQRVIAGVESPVTHLEYVWAGGSPPSEQEYTGAVPVTFIADGQPLIDYLISGNTVQSGTPTPDSPIMPQGTGDLETSGAKAGQYIVPISSAGTTTPIYLGEVETTRKIRKWILTGNESLLAEGLNRGTYRYRVVRPVGERDMLPNPENCVCTHYEYTQMPFPVDPCITIPANSFVRVFTLYDTLEEFRAFLQEQYANGTPVTLWYILAEPETAVVNEPLMKIGDYADTLSMEQAGVQIPTVNGSTTLDVETTVKPSEVYIKYRGEAVATLSALPAEASSPEATTEEETPEERNIEEMEDTENGSEDISLQHKPETIE